MTENEPKQTSWANLRHGAYRYLASGNLPPDMQGFDSELTGRLVELAGGDEKYLPQATIAARCMTAAELISRYIDATIGKVQEKGLDISQAVPVLLPVFKVYNSYLEGSRRNLAELGLTPASAARVKLDKDPVSAAKVLESLQGKDDENNPSE